MSDRIRRPDDPMTDAAKDDVARTSARGDVLQEAITRAALDEVGGRSLVVRRRTDADVERYPSVVKIPLWVASFSDKPQTLAAAFGVAIIGGDTREEAVGDAERFASKWGWGVEVEAEG